MIWQELAIARSQLGVLRPLDAGGQGRLFRVPEFYLPETPVPLVYKEYHPSLRNVAPQGMANIIALRSMLAADQRAWFDNHLTWPLRIVLERNDPALPVAGVVMRLIPDDFFQLTAIDGEARRVPREARFLFHDRMTANRMGLEFPDEPRRWLLCLRMSYLIAFLHNRKIVFGDISARNTLYRLAPTPDVLLVDCDAVRKVGSAPVVAQGHAPNFLPPDPYEPQSIATDLYKLGLFIVRVLTPGHRITRDNALAFANEALDPTGAAMLLAGLDKNPQVRVPALTWYRYFRSKVLPAVS